MHPHKHKNFVLLNKPSKSKFSLMLDWIFGHVHGVGVITNKRNGVSEYTKVF